MDGSQMLDGRRIAVIGGGPVGLEAALYASELGADVRVYERGAIARHVAEWGHIHMFTPFGMNHSPLGRRVLESEGCKIPDDETFQTGAEWRESYLLPLAKRTALADRLALGDRVVTIGRAGLLKGDHIGDDARSRQPFTLLIEAGGFEHYEEADLVLDCSGSWGIPNRLGRGGVPALGERGARPHISYHPVDVAGEQRERYAGRRTLLVGGGLSAATTAVALAGLAAEVDGTRVVWATRRAGEVPILPLEGDTLERRVELTHAANRVAAEPARGVEWLPDAEVRAIHWNAPAAEFEVALHSATGGERAETFDRVIANVGYGPDSSIYKELQIHECWASRAPMKLAVSLAAAQADAGGDCLKLGGFGPEVLVNPEPGFFILGMKSYGRNSAFLMSTGVEQVRDVFRLISGRADLDLYGGREGDR
jgi:thioredoxin reductase